MSRLATLRGLVAHFIARRKFFFIPLLLVLLLAGALMLFTGGLSYVAPFVYTLF
jgi:hypothetical protein